MVLVRPAGIDPATLGFREAERATTPLNKTLDDEHQCSSDVAKQSGYIDEARISATRARCIVGRRSSRHPPANSLRSLRGPRMLLSDPDEGLAKDSRSTRRLSVVAKECP